MTTRRHINRPNGAYKLLTSLLYGSYPSSLEVEKGLVRVRSIRRLARLLGTQSSRLNTWFEWLEDHGYIEAAAWSSDRRQIELRLRKPINVRQ